MIIEENWREMPKRRQVHKKCERCLNTVKVTVAALKQSNNETHCKPCVGAMRMESWDRVAMGKKHSEKMKGRWTGEKNNQWGVKHTLEYKQKMSEIITNSEAKNKAHAAFWAGDTTKTRKKMSDAKIGMKPLPPYKKHWSLYDIRFRSGWEAAFAAYLTFFGIDWQYETKTLKLSNGKGYTPDFYLNNTFYEIKGGYYTDDEKYFMAKKEFPELNFKILYRSELQKIGALDARSKPAYLLTDRIINYKPLEILENING